MTKQFSELTDSSNFFRRIVKDYEYTVQSSAAWLILANMTIMLQRIPIRME